MPDDRLIARVRGEYLEMPGLRLTLDQASRLWGLEPQACRHVLGALIELGFLSCGADGRYARSSSERRTAPALRMAKASAPETTNASQTISS
ncbi:MAG: hypothetical protein AB7P22_04455 [Vicinamibacterales bacterium]